MDEEIREQRLASVKRWARAAQQDLLIYLVLLVAGLLLVAWVDKIEWLSQIPAPVRDTLIACVSVPAVGHKLHSRWKLWRRTLPWLEQVYGSKEATDAAESVFQHIALELDGRDVLMKGST